MKPLLSSEHNDTLRALYCRLMESMVCEGDRLVLLALTSSVVWKWRNNSFLTGNGILQCQLTDCKSRIRRYEC